MSVRGRLRSPALLLVIGLALHLTCWAQANKNDTAKALADSAASGIKLTARTSVRGLVDVDAVLIPAPAVARLFGKEISKTYAVVQLTISNKSPDYSFVLHSAFIDTTQWALGSGAAGFKSDPEKETSQTSNNRSQQIASVEARIARGQLLDAQQWNARNWTVRLLTILGGVASGYSFSFRELGISKGIAAFNGSVIPGVGYVWPDGTVPQLNRISDFGYHTNKIVGKDSGDIIVCFFPISVFLSPHFAHIFTSTPGLLVSPYQLLYDPKAKRFLEELEPNADLDKLKKLYVCYSAHPKPSSEATDGCQQTLAQDPANTQLLNFIGRLGLENIGVFVEGVMTVDVSVVPAAIDQITFADDVSKSEFWNLTGEHKGVIKGKYLDGGTVEILEGKDLGMSLKTNQDESSGDALNFVLTISKPVKTAQSLHFVVAKSSTDPRRPNTIVKSNIFEFPVAYVNVAH